MADPTPGNVESNSAANSAEVFGTLNAHLLNRRLSEAEVLLSYAVETGVQVDPNVSRSILEAGTASRTGWTADTAANLLTAEATLAAKLKPVSAESLQNCALYRSRSLTRRLLLPTTMVVLATVIVLYSTAAVLFSSFSKSIRANLDVANPLAVRLASELGPPAETPDKNLCLNSNPTAGAAQGAADADTLKPLPPVYRRAVIQDLQTFAAAIRDMYGVARRMNRPVRFQTDPFRPDTNKSITAAEINKILELPPGLPNPALAATERICVYQRVRYYAQSTEESANIFTGAVATTILPVLYALLGAGAYVLRRLECQLRSRTFTNEAQSPRFITAAIAGAVVGVFNFGQGISVSPLAIAFLAGYAVDVFFTFLESTIRSLSRGRGSAGSDQATPGLEK